jgi:putative transposase
VDGKGGILSVAVAGANVHDTKMLAETIAAMIVGRPYPEEGPQHLCLDKGYDNPTGKSAAMAEGYVAHIRRIGEEEFDARRNKKHPARRWVVERAGAWLSKCRSILVRYNKKSSNYLGLIQLAVSLLWYRRAVKLAPLKIPDEVLR